MFDSMNGIADTAPACCTAGSAPSRSIVVSKNAPQVGGRRVDGPRQTPARPARDRAESRDRRSSGRRSCGAAARRRTAGPAPPRPRRRRARRAGDAATDRAVVVLRPAPARPVRATRHAGRMPESSATTADITPANASARQSSCSVSIHGTVAGPSRAIASSAHIASAAPAIPPATAITRLSSSSCCIDPAAAGAERDAHGHLALARRAAREQQVGDVDAGDEQHERRRRRRAASRASSDVADEMIAQRPARARRSSRWSAAARRPAARDRGHLGLGGLERRRRPSAGRRRPSSRCRECAARKPRSPWAARRCADAPCSRAGAARTTPGRCRRSSAARRRSRPRFRPPTDRRRSAGARTPR